LYGMLNFAPTVEYWLNSNNTYRVVFIQVRVFTICLTPKRLTQYNIRIKLRGLSSPEATSLSMPIGKVGLKGMAK
jgi:hypothetical protein